MPRIDFEQKLLLIEERLKKAKIKDFEVYFQARLGRSFLFQDQRRDLWETRQSLGYGLRVLEAGRLGFSYGNDFSAEAIDHTIKSAVALCRFNPKAEGFLGFAAAEDYPDIPGLYDPCMAQQSEELIKEQLFSLREQALGSDPRVSAVKDLSYEEEEEHVALVSSAGFRGHFQRSSFTRSLGVLAEQGDNQQLSYELDSKTSLQALGNDLGRDAAFAACRLLGAKALNSYKGAYVLHRDVVVELLELLISNFYAEQIVKGNSRLEGRFGETVFSQNFNLIDDATLPGGLESYPFDAEGSVSSAWDLVQNGVPASVLGDRRWSQLAGVACSGHGHRSDHTDLPSISCSNLYVPNGDTSFKDLLKQMHNGLVVTEVIGLHNADSVSGDFSVGIQGYAVKDGDFNGGVTAMVWSDNFYDLLASELLWASDQKFYGGVGAPSVLVAKGQFYGQETG
ncbi:MAG: TldD/PmbA family protein [Deltaproteobacteria bacterium]|nr:TldD/PmbA family protein [Deltaproteobacteria bacterium]